MQKSKRVISVGDVFDSRRPGRTSVDDATSAKVKVINKRKIYKCITHSLTMGIIHLCLESKTLRFYFKIVISKLSPTLLYMYFS